MSEIILHPTSAHCVTCVPDYFIDRFMVDANGEYVKVFLYLLRSLGRQNSVFSISNIAEALDHTQKDIRKALAYWENCGLLELSYDDCHELKGIYLTVPDTCPPEEECSGSQEHVAFEVSSKRAEPLPAPVIEPSFAPASDAGLSVVPEPTITEAFADQESLSEIMYMAEKLIGSQITREDMETVIFWHDTLHFSWELIEYIIEYSVEKGAKSFKYMDKIAQSYAENNVRTVKEAKIESYSYLSVTFTVKNAFGIKNRNLAQSEMEYLNRWTKDFGFSAEIITEACNRTILKAHAPSFDYADSILKNWFEAGVRSLEDVALLDSKHSLTAAKNFSKRNNQRPLKNFTERSNIDYQDLEKTLLNS